MTFTQLLIKIRCAISFYSPAVQSAKKNWRVSKKKNITRSENEAPTGKNTACAVLIVWNPDGWKYRNVKMQKSLVNIQRKNSNTYVWSIY